MESSCLELVDEDVLVEGIGGREGGNSREEGGKEREREITEGQNSAPKDPQVLSIDSQKSLKG